MGIIGITTAGRIAVGLVEDNRVTAPVSFYPAEGEGAGDDVIHSMPMDEIAGTAVRLVKALCQERQVSPSALGICFPGIIRDGLIEESPNLKQAKGTNIGKLLTQSLENVGIAMRVSVCNDADATATGIAAQRGQMEKLIRVWTLGHGVGFGRYPHSPGPCEGGHTVVTLDPKETYCGCGGRGHLEGIMGHRAMRLRFLDLEPEEVFENARQGDRRCADFELLWHRALAAATATSVHLEGPGKFFVTGSNARFVRAGMLSESLQDMVKMSPLQGSVFEIIPANDELALVGAAVNAQMSE
jgi:glucokinase